MIPKFGFNALEKLVNAYLGLDPVIFTQLHEFQGKIAKISLLDLKLDFYIEVREKGFHLAPRMGQEACTWIEGSCVDLFKMVSGQQGQPKLVSQHIKIQGDLDFGQALYKIMREIDIDWEEHLSKFVGDNLAYQLMQQARSTLGFLKKSMNTLCNNTQEYIQEEACFSPSVAEVEDFYEAVATLRDDTDRLEHKLMLHLARNKHV